MNNEVKKGFWMHKQSGRVFTSLRKLKIVDDTHYEESLRPKPYELRSEAYMVLISEKELKENFVKL